MTRQLLPFILLATACGTSNPPKLPPPEPAPNGLSSEERDLVNAGQAATHCRPTASTPQGADCISKEDVKRVVHSKQTDLRRCYDRELKKNPRLEGKATFAWIINAEGGVERFELLDVTLPSQDVLTCARKALSFVEFPRRSPSSPLVEITFPYTVSAEENQLGRGVRDGDAALVD